MSTLGELLKRMPGDVDEGAIPIRPEICKKAPPFPTLSVRDEQIHALVQQLFLRHEAGLVRNVGFAPTEESMQMAPLCLDVARVLAAQGNYHVGLIDAGFDPFPLHEQLQIPAPSPSKVTWPVSPRLGLVPRQS
ncbi:MAG: hypothetical protein WA172_11905, partial [Terriglobales bacterium]